MTESGTKPNREILLWAVAGALGALLVAWAFPRVYPLVPKDWEVSESEARLIALEALRDLGEAVADPYVVVRIRSDAQLERRLQILSSEIDHEQLVTSRLAAAQLCWDVMVYPPGALPGEWTYRAFVAPNGEILMLRRRDPQGTDPNLDDEAARRLGAEYLLEQRIDLTSLRMPGDVVRNSAGTLHDVRLQLRSTEAALGPDYPYGIEVYFAGREVAGFGLWYDDPDRDEVERLLRQMQIFGVSNIVVLFLVLPFVAVPFLRRYHDGQLGVRRGVQILVLTLVTAAVFTWLNQDSISEGSNIGFITRRQMAWIAAGFTLIFVHFVAAVLGLMSWSVGEYFCRQDQPQKLAAIDSLLRFKWSNATVARSALRGVAGGLLMTGLLLALGVAIQQRGVWAVAGVVYTDVLGQSLGSLSALSQSIATAVPLYLFAAIPGAVLGTSPLGSRSRIPGLLVGGRSLLAAADRVAAPRKLGDLGRGRRDPGVPFPFRRRALGAAGRRHGADHARGGAGAFRRRHPDGAQRLGRSLLRRFAPGAHRCVF